jgi:hypothetical protein
MRDLQPSMAARFGAHLWFRGFLKARIGLTTVAKIALEQQKTEKFSSILRTDEEKAGRFPKERIIPTAELELFAAFRTGGGMTRCFGSCPKVEGLFRPVSLVMNKQPTLEQDRKKRRSRVKLHDVPAKKNLKGGSSAKSAASENGSPGIPTSLQEFLKRDSLPIKSD